MHSYDPTQKTTLYNNLSQGRKVNVVDIMNNNEQIFLKWKNEIIVQNQSYKEGLIYKTDRGEMVRSKSELIIANILNSITDIHYRYEAPLHLTNTRITIHPDFTIMRKSDNKIFYWEHFGRMSDVEYTENLCLKMNHYIGEGLYQSGSLIMTYESDNVPLSTEMINSIVRYYFIECN